MKNEGLCNLLRVSVRVISFAVCFLFSGFSVYAQDSNDKETEKDQEVNASSTLVNFYYQSRVDDQPFAYITKSKNYLLKYPNLFLTEREYYSDQVEVIEMGMSKKYGRRVRRDFNNRMIYSDTPVKNPSIFHDDSRIKMISYAPEVMLPYYMDKEDVTADNNYYHSVLKYRDLRYLPSLFFHEGKSVASKSIKVEVPNWLELEIKEVNFEGFEIEKVIEKSSRRTVYTYILVDIPKYKEANFSTSWQVTKPHLLLLPKTTTVRKDSLEYFVEIQDLYNWYKGLVDSLDNDHSELKPLVSQLVNKDNTDKENVESIFYWVQDKIRYLAFEDGIAGFKPENAQIVYQDKFGDCKGMANLLTEMLKLAGYQAHLSWIGTRGKKDAYDYSIPSLMVDNHMISTLYLNGERYFLDPTEKFVSLGEYAYRIQGRPVMIEQGDSFSIEYVPVSTLDKPNHSRISHCSLDLEGQQIKGLETITLSGEKKMDFLRAYSSIKLNDREEFLYGCFDVSTRVEEYDITISDLSDRAQPINVQLSYLGKYDLIPSSKGYYFYYDYSEELNNVEKDRKESIFFHEKIFKEEIFEFEIPTEFKLSSLPEGLIVENQDFVFSHTYELEGNMFRFKSKVMVPDGVINRDNIEAWYDALEFAALNRKNLMKIIRL